MNDEQRIREVVGMMNDYHARKAVAITDKTSAIEEITWEIERRRRLPGPSLEGLDDAIRRSTYELIEALADIERFDDFHETHPEIFDRVHWCLGKLRRVV